VELHTPSLRYQRTRPAPAASASTELAFIKLRYKLPDQDRSRLFSQAVTEEEATRLSDDYWFSAAVAGFGMVLRDSRYRGTADVNAVLALARRSVGDDPEGYRRQFVAMVERYGHIARHEPVDPEPDDLADR
jgi:Ca-activated chloride channel family protein